MIVRFYGLEHVSLCSKTRYGVPGDGGVWSRFAVLRRRLEACRSKGGYLLGNGDREKYARRMFGLIAGRFCSRPKISVTEVMLQVRKEALLACVLNLRF